MDLRNDIQKVYCCIAQMGDLGLLLLWYFLQLLVSIWYFAVGVACMLESNLISSGLLKRYKSLDLGKLQNLAIVIESEEAYQISKVIELLQWLEVIGVRNVCLYDSKGVLKKSKEVILEKLSNTTLSKVNGGSDSLVDKNSLEFVSFSDGKEAVTKAANLLFMKYMKSGKVNGSMEETVFTETQMAEALGAIGCGMSHPKLLLVYGPSRCHLGFPAWRIPYTEIAHMGPLKSMKYGSLVKAIYKVTTVRQNYGK